MAKPTHTNRMLKALATISVDDKRIVANVSDDFVKLYYWFIARRYWVRMNQPLHGSHITIYNSKFHIGDYDKEKAKKYHGQQIEFTYDPYIVEGGYTKGFIMYYMKVYSDAIDGMKNDLDIWDGPKYRGLHITLANGKSNSVFPDWPKMIEIRK